MNSIHSSNQSSLSFALYRQCYFDLSIASDELCSLRNFEDFKDEDLDDPVVDRMLQSFRFVRCCYDHFDVPSHHFLHALRSSA